MMRFKRFVLSALLVVASTVVHAALIDRGGGMIYDTDLNITWLQDANYAQTSGYSAGGYMTWAEANAWAAGLSFGGFSDWRLPATLQPDASCSSQYMPDGLSWAYNCTGSEMGHLFYAELGGAALQGIFLSNDPDLSVFRNIQHYGYWSETAYAPRADSAWSFGMDDGGQFDRYTIYTGYAWAVRNGDVSTVLEPSSLVLAGLGLGCLGWGRRRNRWSV